MTERMKVLFAALVLLLVVSFATPLTAQVTSTQASAQAAPPPGCVVVRNGDGFWLIAKRHLTATEWKGIYEKNPNTADGKRRKIWIGKNGWTYITTIPGEFLCGLEELGLGTPVLTSPTELEAMGFKVPKVETKVEVPVMSPWSWLPLGILLAIALALLIAYLLLRRDPTRVGAGPVVNGGIQTPMAAATHLRNQIAEEYRCRPSQVEIVSLVRGNGFGFARITDRLSSLFGRLLNGELIWQVTARTPISGQFVRYSLLGCANDVRAGGGMIPGFGFRFVPTEDVTSQLVPPTPDPVVVPVSTPASRADGTGGSGLPDSPTPKEEKVEVKQPEPEVQTVPATPTAIVTTPKPSTSPLPVVQEGVVRFEFRKPEGDKPSYMELTGVNETESFTVQRAPGSIMIRFTEKS